MSCCPPALAAACKDLKSSKTKIVVELETPPPVFDLTRSRREINRNQELAHKEWLKKNNMESVWKSANMETAGVASGGVAHAADFKMSARYKDSYGLHACIYFDSVHVAMMYRTIISIPEEFEKGGCAYNDIYAHEMRHHDTNEAIVREAVTRFEKDLPKLIYMMENQNMPVDSGHIKIAINSMQNQLKDAFKIYLGEEIEREMRRRNALIDSPEEYARGSEVLAACGVTP